MSKGIRLTYEYVKQFFLSQGCELLEKEYKDSSTKMRYRCICGNESSIVFYSFRAGNRCRQCGRRKIAESNALTHEQVVEQFKKHGCELLDFYVKSGLPMTYRCVCGKIARISWNNFQRGRRCLACGISRRSGSNHYEWLPDREAKNENYLFRQRAYKLVKMSLNATGRVKNKKTAALLGYDSKQLQEYIKGHPNFDTIKNGRWHIDHIFPINAFVKYGIFDLKLINGLDNLQPLGYKENISKSDNYDKDAFEKWLIEKGVNLNDNIEGRANANEV